MDQAAPAATVALSAPGTRTLIGQAMGILMEIDNLDSDRASEVLKRISQHIHRKLRDVAQELAAS